MNPWKIISSNMKINEISITRSKLYDSNQLDKWLNQKVQQNSWNLVTQSSNHLKQLKIGSLVLRSHKEKNFTLNAMDLQLCENLTNHSSTNYYKVTMLKEVK